MDDSKNQFIMSDTRLTRETEVVEGVKQRDATVNRSNSQCKKKRIKRNKCFVVLLKSYSSSESTSIEQQATRAPALPDAPAKSSGSACRTIPRSPMYDSRNTSNDIILSLMLTLT